MEFSEVNELNRIASSIVKSNLINPFRSAKKLSPLQHPHISQHSPDSLSKSPNLSNNPQLQGQVQKSLECRKSCVLPAFSIEKDNSYLTERPTNKRSSLTLLLSQPDEQTLSTPIKQLVLEVYFFRSPIKFKLIVPPEITVSGMLRKALQAYSKYIYSILPLGNNANAYQVWLPEEDTHLPDFDYALDQNIQISILGVSCFCVCEKIGCADIFSDKKPGIRSLKATNLTQMKDKNLTLIKFHFKGSWAHLAVQKNWRLANVLPILQRKFFFSGAEKDFEFRVFIQDTGEECPVDMTLLIKDLGFSEIKLYRKKLADNPRYRKSLKYIR
ncbi:hypothetical protein SteCoe_36356 [Stentor coeruleus]|uniref:Uncharacterized protein n=1 Tax=Stentor coeruleus TaxID=5963 RepID=A0A1R2AQ93_9CILI|nr:hypothetical protein SteCoe_36356 [Stentor coeruleus]